MRTPSEKFKTDLNDLNNFLTNLNFAPKPTVHVNPQYQGAVIVVDFGTPVNPHPALSSEQFNEMSTRMKNLAKELLPTKQSNVRISNDSNNGVYWAGSPL